MKNCMRSSLPLSCEWLKLTSLALAAGMVGVACSGAGEADPNPFAQSTNGASSTTSTPSSALTPPAHAYPPGSPATPATNTATSASSPASTAAAPAAAASPSRSELTNVARTNTAAGQPPPSADTADEVDDHGGDDGSGDDHADDDGGGDDHADDDGNSGATPPANTNPPPANPPPANTNPPPANTNPSAVVGFDAQIFPILRAECGRCHSGGGLPALASANVDTAFNTARSLAARIVSLVRAGDMPADTCSGPPGSSGCVSTADFSLIQQWVNGGTPR